MKKGYVIILLLSFILYIYFSFISTPPFIAVPSKSMEPHYKIGELIFVKEVNPSNIKVGDVIVVSVPREAMNKYNYPQSVIHRVADIFENDYGTAFSLKGDNNKEKDPFVVYEANIEGKAFFSAPYIGHIFLFLHSSFGKYFIGVLFFLYFLKYVYRMLKKQIPILVNHTALVLMSIVEKDLRYLKEELRSQSKQIEELKNQIDDLKDRI